MYGGFDWSGKPDKDERLICSLAATDDLESWSRRCLTIRRELGMAQHAEFHARDMSEPNILAFLLSAREAEIVIGALVVEKAAKPMADQLVAFDYAPLAQELFRIFSARYKFRQLWYDTEIQGHRAEKAFETELCRINRAIYPDTVFKARGRPSNKSDLIQVADSVAYVLNRQARGVLKYKPLQELMDEIAMDKRNVIVR